MIANRISASELATLVRSGAKLDLVDVRTPVEFREVHLTMARNVPLSQLDPAQFPPGGEPLYIVCQSGSRGRQACERLLLSGRTNVVNIEGGTSACIAAGMPVVRGSKAIGLERQVRIAAGILVVIGVAAGYFVSPAFLGLSAFIGAGLVVAGITDTCGMGMLLARMPWNQTVPTTRTDCEVAK